MGISLTTSLHFEIALGFIFQMVGEMRRSLVVNSFLYLTTHADKLFCIFYTQDMQPYFVARLFNVHA